MLATANLGFLTITYLHFHYHDIILSYTAHYAAVMHHTNKEMY